MAVHFVTGGAGFIGSHVVDRLISDGQRVVIIDNLSTGRRENLNPAATFCELDLCDGNLEELFAQQRPEYVHHLAAQIDVRQSVDDPARDAYINIVGSLRLLETCRKSDVHKIVYVGTGGAVYGEPETLPADESHPVRPDAPYGISKHSVEHYLQYYGKIHGMRWTALRLSNVYGPRQDPLGEAGVNAIFIGQMLSGQVPTIFGDGEQLRDYVYVGDVADAVMRATADADGEIVNIGTGVPTSVNRIYELIREIVGFDQSPRYAEPRAGEVSRIYLNVDHARDVLGWSPTVELTEGLRRTIEWHRSVQ